MKLVNQHTMQDIQIDLFTEEKKYFFFSKALIYILIIPGSILTGTPCRPWPSRSFSAVCIDL